MCLERISNWTDRNLPILAFGIFIIGVVIAIITIVLREGLELSIYLAGLGFAATYIIFSVSLFSNILTNNKLNNIKEILERIEN